ncbi:hypothetical protein K432DRAFT_397826 [Lepidopterella palustris CBS 459.81]|uniref:Uncharacterized protein n=1 Tax=Lepidopterella palustris CBS 459.81 TaxID=1314670 RepID=A0A8E2J9Z2_9PEZI|nr:hypothetical protein K432DRAFT_397826 [Lepidopterella palustris CBS 459.81]
MAYIIVSCIIIVIPCAALAQVKDSVKRITPSPDKPLSDDAITRLGRLRRRLGSALKGGYILGGLKDAIKQDPNFCLFVSIKPINEEAFNYKDKYTLADFALVDTL